MNLLQIRQWLVRESGRYDLVIDTATWADNGANAVIEAAQKALDRMQTTSKSVGRNFQMVAADTFSVSFQNCRSIKEVWAAQDGAGRWKLEKKSMEWLREYYSDMQTIESGQPLYYTPATFRAAPELHLTPIADFDGIIAYLDVMYDAHYAYNGVLFFPPADGDYMIETWGQFYSTVMSEDTHESYWSVNHPDLLVLSAQAVLEKFNRNTQGYNDIMLGIKMELAGIDLDLVEEEIADVSQMEG